VSQESVTFMLLDEEIFAFKYEPSSNHS